MSFFVWSLSECKLFWPRPRGHGLLGGLLCCGGGRLRRGRCLWILLFIDLLCVEVDVLALPGFGRRWVVMIIRCKKLIYL